MSEEWQHNRPAARPDADWLAKWAPRCPDGNPQRLLKILGFRLKGEDYLQLRVVLPRGPGFGVCQTIVDEHPDRIYVRVIACLPDEDPEEETDRPDRSWIRTEAIDGPCNCWLDAPLGERVVVDVDTDEALPLYIPRWGTGEDSLYVPRPPGALWSSEDVAEAG